MSTLAEAPFAAAAPGAAADKCFHCGEPLPPAGAYPVEFEGESRPTCCRGCQAVARTIIDNGLAAYYRNRSALPPPISIPDEGEGVDALQHYDLPEVQRGFVRETDAAGHEKEAALLLDGITCAACSWLIGGRVMRLPGVAGASINYATRRARVRWDDRRTRLSTILRAIRALGYGAQPYDSARSDDQLMRERRSM
ncbi:MAG: heavy metal translocating P-type ATPase metal-binding domain-containing protein, partial [Betaproteobacteria bacterium]|nr:heavy metal translocating P-type ATPase metal-binding domain-containing protein [Betaproteobacteria bacterium]